MDTPAPAGARLGHDRRLRWGLDRHPAVSAPYAHFADRDDLLAAVAVHAYELFYAELRL